jgi:Tfp pilus assembly protein PilX
VENRAQGNVIAIVLLILAVVSIAGVGSLTISRYDIKFTSASKNYDRGFSLADGAAVMAYQDLKTHDREQSSSFTDPANPAPPFIIGCPCTDWSQCKDATSRKTCTKCMPTTSGDYLVQLQLMGYSTAPQLSVGWESSGYYAEYWSGYGASTPTNTTLYSAGVETDVQKTKQK